EVRRRRLSLETAVRRAESGPLGKIGDLERQGVAVRIACRGLKGILRVLHDGRRRRARDDRRRVAARRGAVAAARGAAPAAGRADARGWAVAASGRRRRGVVAAAGGDAETQTYENTKPNPLNTL